MENNILYMEFLSPNMEPSLTSMEAGILNVDYQSLDMESSPQKNGTLMFHLWNFNLEAGPVSKSFQHGIQCLES